MTDLEPLKTDGARLCEVLGVKKPGPHNPCPFCEDKTALSVFEDGGQYGFKCFKCDEKGDIITAAMKLYRLDFTAAVARLTGTPASANTPRPEKPEKPKTVHPDLNTLAKAAEFSDDDERRKVAKTFIYTDPDTGHQDLIVFRLEKPGTKKTCRQGRQVNGGYVLCGCPKGGAPLYNRARLKTANVVVIVEGEPKVHALHEYGIVATCSPGGSDGAASANWQPLNGKRLAILWPDHDAINPKTGKKPGLEYARAVVAELAKLPSPPAAKVVDPAKTGLPEDGSDVVDFIEELKTDGKSESEIKAGIQAILDRAEATGNLAALERELTDATAGRRRCIALPWCGLSAACRALLPGNVTILAGAPGTVKSFALLQAVRFWTKAGLPAAALMLEDGGAFHSRRALAQEAGNGLLTDDEWCCAHSPEVQAAVQAARPALEKLTPALDVLSDDEAPTVEILAKWIERRAASCRVLAIDPISIMAKGPRPWEDDGKFLGQAKRIIERAGVSLILIAHFRKLQSNAKPTALSLDDLAGGAAYARFSHCVLFLQTVETKTGSIKTPMGVLEEQYNRTITIFKSRNGPGTGRKYAFQFDPKSLTLNELGELL